MRIFRFIFICLILPYAFICCQRKEMSLEKEYPLMGTFLQINVRECRSFTQEELEKILNEAYNKGKEIESRFSLYDKNSELTSFNSQEEGIYSVSMDFMELLVLSHQIYLITDGAFDPTIKPLVERWGFYVHQNTSKPGTDDLKDIMQRIGMDKLDLDINNNIVIKKSKVELDFGGIGKGFAVDRISRYLLESGCSKFLVNLGGNLYACNRTGDDFLWRIGIKDPEGGDEPYKIIKTANRGISTSASYYNFLTKDGDVLSHIIDPKTGYPVDHRVSATIISDSAGLSDGLSTAFCVLGHEKSSHVASELVDMDGIILVTGDGDCLEYTVNNFDRLTD